MRSACSAASAGNRAWRGDDGEMKAKRAPELSEAGWQELPRRGGRRRREGLRNLEALAVLAREQRVRLLVVLERLGLAVEHERMSGQIRDVREVRERGGQGPLEDVARQDFRVVRADRIHEVLVVRELDAGQHVWIAAAAALDRRLGARPFFVLRAHVRLPRAAVAVDPDPALRPVEQVADSLRPLVVRELTPRAELEDRAVAIFEEGRLNVRCLLR